MKAGKTAKVRINARNLSIMAIRHTTFVHRSHQGDPKSTHFVEEGKIFYNLVIPICYEHLLAE